jgi:hypothetical protein
MPMLMLDGLARDKHFHLLQKLESYGQKSFMTFGPGV